MVIHCTTLDGATLITDRGALYISYHLEMNANKARGKGNGNLLQYSCLENPMDRGAWQATAMGSQRVRHKLENEQEQEVFNEMLRNWIGLNWFGWSCSKSLI